MEKYLFVPYFCGSEYRNEALKNAKNEDAKSEIEKTYGIYRRFICRPVVNGMIDNYLLDKKNPLNIKEGELYDNILRALSNRRINVWVEEIPAAPKKEVKPVEEAPKQEEPVENVETSVEQPVETEPTVEETPVEEAPKATTPKKKKSTKKSE